MRKTAIKAGLTQEQFWGMTPHEFNLQVEAHREKEELELEKKAWQIASTVNHLAVKIIKGMNGKKVRGLRIKDLINNKQDEKTLGDFNNPEELYEWVEQQKGR